MDDDYTATIDYELFTKQWCVRIRYVKSEANGRKKYASLLLVPHSGEMFGKVCESIPLAIERHRREKAA